MKKIPVICYATPQGNTYLASYGCSTPEENQAFIQELNENPKKRTDFCKQHRIKENTVAYFYHHEQEPF